MLSRQNMQMNDLGYELIKQQRFKERNLKAPMIHNDHNIMNQ